MRLICIKTVIRKYGTSKDAKCWYDILYPIKGCTYNSTHKRIDCEGDVGYKIEGLDGWWSGTLFKKAELSDFVFESDEVVLNECLTAVT